MIERIDILGVKVHAVTYAQVLDIINRWVVETGPHQIATANPEFVMAAQHNPEFCRVLNHADLCVADGVGLLWAARRLGRVLPERVTGSDLVPLLARKSAENGWRIYLLGAGPGVAERTSQILLSQNPALRIAGVYAGSPAEADAPAVIATAVACAPNSKLPEVNSSSARLSWKKMIWL